MVQLITVAMFLIAGITGAMLCYIGKLSWRESTYKNYFSGSVVGGDPLLSYMFIPILCARDMAPYHVEI